MGRGMGNDDFDFGDSGSFDGFDGGGSFNGFSGGRKDSDFTDDDDLFAPDNEDSEDGWADDDADAGWGDDTDSGWDNSPSSGSTTYVNTPDLSYGRKGNDSYDSDFVDSDDDWGGDSSSDEDWGDNIEGSADMEGYGVEQEDSERKREIKRTALFGIAGALVVIIIVCLVARFKNAAEHAPERDNDRVVEETKANKRKDNKKETTAPTSAPVSNKAVSGDWKAVQYDNTWSLSDELTGTFTVTSIDTYARILQNGEVQLKTEVTGSISGLTGSYVAEVPAEITPVIKIASQLNVSYQIAESGGNRVVANITIE